jgi:hypothetical protein
MRLFLVMILLLPYASPVARADVKPANSRLKHVNHTLQGIAGRMRSSRGLGGTGEVIAGTVFTYTGVGLVVGTAKYMNQPNLGDTGNFSVDLGHAFIDAYGRVPGAILGASTGAVLTYTGLRLTFGGIADISHPTAVERYYYEEFEKMPQSNPAEIERKADLGEARLKEIVAQARHDRLFYGWTTLSCGALMLIAATAHPDQPAGFFLGGGAGVYGFVSLLTDSQTEEEYADFVAWETDTPRDTSRRSGGWTVAALPTPRSLALGLSWGF